MTDHEQTQHEPTENGELEPEGEGGGLDAEDQAGKGYGRDEGEREEALEQ